MDRKTQRRDCTEPMKIEDLLDDSTASIINGTSTLREWVQRYPEQQRELTDFAVSWGLMESGRPEPGTTGQENQQDEQNRGKNRSQR